MKKNEKLKEALLIELVLCVWEKDMLVSTYMSHVFMRLNHEHKMAASLRL